MWGMFTDREIPHFPQTIILTFFGMLKNILPVNAIAIDQKIVSGLFLMKI